MESSVKKQQKIEIKIKQAYLNYIQKNQTDTKSSVYIVISLQEQKYWATAGPVSNVVFFKDNFTFIIFDEDASINFEMKFFDKFDKITRQESKNIKIANLNHGEVEFENIGSIKIETRLITEELEINDMNSPLGSVVGGDNQKSRNQLLGTEISGE